MTSLQILAKTPLGLRILIQIRRNIESGKLRIQTSQTLFEKMQCRAAFYTDGVAGTVFVDPKLDGYAGALIIYHEFIHALDEEYRAKRFLEKTKKTKDPNTELAAERKAYQCVHELIQELKVHDPGFGKYLRSVRKQGINLDRLFSDQEIRLAHELKDAG